MGQRILKISEQLFPFLFSGEKHYRVTEYPIPEGTRIVNVGLEFPYRAGNNTVAFLLESPEWSDIPDGELIPAISPVMQTIRDDNDH